MRRSRSVLGRWLAPCRAIARRRREVVVTPTADGRIALIVPAEVTVLNVLAAGRLCGALRDACFALDDPETAQDHRHTIATAGGCP